MSQKGYTREDMQCPEMATINGKITARARLKNKSFQNPTKIKENVAFFTVRFLYLALLVALFIPYMVTLL